jgi:hypothetical protein
MTDDVEAGITTRKSPSERLIAQPDDPTRSAPHPQGADPVVVGVHPHDIAWLRETLAGLTYPAEKWQVIAHAMTEPAACRIAVKPRTLQQLWALPPGRYASFPHILAGVARTARGHPRRS